MRIFFKKKTENIEIDLISIQPEISKVDSLVTRIKESTLILKSKWKFAVAVSSLIVFLLLGFVLHAHITRFVMIKSSASIKVCRENRNNGRVIVQNKTTSILSSRPKVDESLLPSVIVLGLESRNYTPTQVPITLNSSTYENVLLLTPGMVILLFGTATKFHKSVNKIISEL